MWCVESGDGGRGNEGGNGAGGKENCRHGVGVQEWASPLGGMVPDLNNWAGKIKAEVNS